MEKGHIQFRFFIKKIYFLVFLLLCIVGTGIAGYMLLEGYSFTEAAYMTTITVSTTGFREVKALSDTGKYFTIFLIISSFGTFAYVLSSLTQSIVDGELNSFFKSYKMESTISKLNDHVIICGYGRNGKQAAHKLHNYKTPYLVIENDPAAIISMHAAGTITYYIEGDATEEQTLIKAGIKKARAIITSLPKDADNLYVVLTARVINPEIKIISRASEEHADTKLKRAGADSVIMPDKIGGAHMASLVMKPDVIEFLECVMGQGESEINLEELVCENLPEQYLNKSIRELEIRNKSGANIVGFKTAEGQYIINPPPDTLIIPHSKIFVLGTSEQIRKVKEIIQTNRNETF